MAGSGFWSCWQVEAADALVLPLPQPDGERRVALLLDERVSDRRRSRAPAGTSRAAPSFAERRHLDTVDLHRLARSEGEEPARRLRPGSRSRCAGCRATASASPRGRRAPPGPSTSRTSASRRTTSAPDTRRRRLDRAAAQLVRENHPRERRCRLRPRERREVGGPAAAEVVEDRVDDRLVRPSLSTRSSSTSTHAEARPRRRGRGCLSGVPLPRPPSRRAGVEPSTQSVPAGSVAPTSSDVSNALPASAGALQSEWSRVHSQTHAAFGLSGSLPAGLNAAQPHDQTVAICSSVAICFNTNLPLDDVEPARAPKSLRVHLRSGSS